MRSAGTVRAVLVRAMVASFVCSFACSAPAPVATAMPGFAEPADESERPSNVASGNVAASLAPRPGPSGEQHELEQVFGANKALATLVGEASYYSDALAGRKTASGEPYDPDAYTAAHRSLPFGTMLRVRRKDTSDVVYVRVNDRGPFGKRRRILDLSKAAARHLGMIRRGIADVRIEVVERPREKR